MPAGWAYFDTSALAKRYVREAGSGRARGLLRRHRFLSSVIAPLELTSAFTRRHAAGELSDRHFQAMLLRVQADRAYWELVEVTPLVLTQAEDLVRTTGLRALDAIHVGSALAFQNSSGLRLPFITADSQQRKAAEQVGLDVVWVG